MRTRLLMMALLAAALVGGGCFWWFNRTPSGLGAAAYEHTKAILAFGPRSPASEGLKSVRGYLRAQLEAAGWVVAGQPFERTTSNGKVAFENLRARFSGGAGEPWQRPVKGLLCAHMDSKLMKDQLFVGADDAASACGAILTIAKVLATENPALAQHLELAFFDGEEAFAHDITPFDGFYGSRFYASEFKDGAPKPAFGVLLDMIGHKKLEIALPADSPQPLLDAVLAAAKKEGEASHFSAARGSPSDDHTPLNLAGIPTVDILGNFPTFKWWHTSGDSLALISAGSLDISIRVTLRVLREELGKAG